MWDYYIRDSIPEENILRDISAAKMSKEAYLEKYFETVKDTILRETEWQS